MAEGDFNLVEKINVKDKEMNIKNVLNNQLNRCMIAMSSGNPYVIGYTIDALEVLLQEQCEDQGYFEKKKKLVEECNKEIEKIKETIFVANVNEFGNEKYHQDVIEASINPMYNYNIARFRLLSRIMSEYSMLLVEKTDTGYE